MFNARVAPSLVTIEDRLYVFFGYACLENQADKRNLIEKIEYVAYNFTQFRPIPFNKREGKVTLDLSDQPLGMYVIIFHLNNGEKLTYKVLKH